MAAVHNYFHMVPLASIIIIMKVDTKELGDLSARATQIVYHYAGS